MTQKSILLRSNLLNLNPYAVKIGSATLKKLNQEEIASLLVSPDSIIFNITNHGLDKNRNETIYIYDKEKNILDITIALGNREVTVRTLEDCSYLKLGSKIIVSDSKNFGINGSFLCTSVSTTGGTTTFKFLGNYIGAEYSELGTNVATKFFINNLPDSLQLNKQYFAKVIDDNRFMLLETTDGNPVATDTNLTYLDLSSINSFNVYKSGYYIRYRITSIDNNRFSSWSPIYFVQDPYADETILSTLDGGTD
jgi:hypothetical protein